MILPSGRYENLKTGKQRFRDIWQMLVKRKAWAFSKMEEQNEEKSKPKQASREGTPQFRWQVTRAWDILDTAIDRPII